MWNNTAVTEREYRDVLEGIDAIAEKLSPRGERELRALRERFKAEIDLVLRDEPPFDVTAEAKKHPWTPAGIEELFQRLHKKELTPNQVSMITERARPWWDKLREYLAHPYA